ncbi:MAG: hypothetical protein H6733_01625 [Alphaproteobacteria bacterium]|nr:hypothetical protein [Alphaproteobacteria bacterium]
MSLVLALLLAACGGAPPASSAPSGTADAVGDGTVAQAHFGEGTPGTLAFTIAAVHGGQTATDAPPWHADGGDWTFVDAKTADGVAFVLGWHETGRFDLGGSTMVMQEAVLAAPTPADGAGLATALGAALHAPVPAGDPGTSPGRLEATAVVLAEHAARSDGGSFSGTGTWDASKWTFERGGHASEIFVNVSVADQRGEFSEKDAVYNADLVADIAAVLRDGAPPDAAGQ